ncbi:amino acid adenylation domain-containing protein [Micromonospora haikouensis]|uniref:amino acid adenylation domain-containing protein n=1 Tax=Micromonospora haikouensis TaxID=686309 RepID=UPI003D941F30
MRSEAVRTDDRHAVQAEVRQLVSAVADGDAPAGDQPGLGLDSMAAVRLTAELEMAFGVQLGLREVRESTGVEELADRVARLVADHGEQTAAPAPTAPAAPAGIDIPAGLTPLQQAYLVGADEQATADPVGCVLYREFDVPDLDADRLRRAWTAVLAHHPMLRARVTTEGRQVAEERLPEPPTVIDVEHDERDRHVIQTRDELTGTRFPIGAYPRVVARVLRCREHGDARVCLVIDAGIADAAAVDILLDHWGRCYQHPGAALPSTGSTVTEAFAALAQRQRRTREGDLAYWERRLAELPAPPRLPYRDTGRRALRRTSLTGRIGPESWQALRLLAGRWRVSESALLLTALLRSLDDGTGDPATVVVTTNDRPRVRDVGDTIGPFTSTLVFAAPGGAAAPSTHAGEVDRLLWSDLEHAGTSGVEVLRRVSRRTAAGVLPVVFTSLLDAGARCRDGFTAAVRHSATITSGVDLEHQVRPDGDGLVVSWDVSERLPLDDARLRFARCLNLLESWAAQEGGSDSTGRLNALQEAYWVSRQHRPAEACQIAVTCTVPGLDVDRLTSAWLRLIARHPVLRTRAGTDGIPRTCSAAVRGWTVPVLAADPGRIRAELCRRPFPAETWPGAEIAVGTDGPTVTIAVDLMHADARGIMRLAGELLAEYSGQQPEPLPESHGETDPAADPQHWIERAAVLRGTSLTHAAGGPRLRRELTLPDWGRRAHHLAERGLRPDDVLLALYLDALTALVPAGEPVSVVRWNPAAPRTVAEHTALSWVTTAPVDPAEVGGRCRELREALTADERADGTPALAGLRMAARRDHRLRAPVLVYTSLLTAPTGRAERDGWLTVTPDVAVDCVGVVSGDHLQLAWDVAADDIDEAALDAAFARFDAAVRRVLDVPGVPAPSRLSPAERHRILHLWNDTARDYVADGPVHVLFERVARTRPDAVAVRYRSGTMTYAELDAHANRIGNRLRAAGIGAGDIVAISTRRGPDMIAAVFGVLKAGAAYLPIEASLPQERARLMLADARAAAVLVNAGRTGWEAPPDCPVVDVSALGDDVPDTPVPLPEEITADSTAYVIYTSGSTGTPKGVVVTHRPVWNLLQWCARTFHFGPDDVGLCVTSLGFDLSVFDILGLLGFGAGLYVADAAQQRDPAELLAILLREPITFWNSAPTTLAQLAPLLPRLVGAAGTDRLRLVFLSGDYTPLTLPDVVRATFTRAQLVSLGGATEATVWSNWFPIERVDPQWRSIPYGRPIDNARYYILDESGEPCPVGVEGDLFIGGECLSAGYLNRPELTAERFVADPFVPFDEARMYRTGDRALFFPDGTICFRGRTDHQVKLRGHRVELDEIAHHLRRHPKVDDVVVLVRRTDDGDQRLVAYVVAADPAAPVTVRELRAWAARTLPDYMLPNHVAAVPFFPATANGKLDRDALPWPLPAAQPGPAAETEPEPAVEAAPQRVPAVEPEPVPAGGTAPFGMDELAGLVAGLIGQPVAPDDDLWDLGATSFTMVQLSNLLAERYGVTMPVAALLDEPTVRGVAARVGPPGRGGDDRPSGSHPPAVRRRADRNSGSDQPRRAATDLLFAADDRDAFKQEHRELRRIDPAEPLWDLPPADADERYLRRRASRRDLAGGVPVESLAGLLGLLRVHEVDGRPRRTYPSAGETYAVQVYLHVRPGGVVGLDPGLYYYRPERHAVQRIAAGADVDRNAHVFYNRTVYDAAGFQLFLIGQPRAIAPLYGAESDRYLALEAGYLGQVLLAGQADHGVGLCPVGLMSFDPIRELLGLDDDQPFLQAFIGGRAPYPETGGPVTESPVPASVPAPAPRPASADTIRAGELAVVGMAGRFAGATGTSALWRLLRSGRRALRPAADLVARWERAGLDPGPVAPAGAVGMMTGDDCFDPRAYRISPREAAGLDPQVRALLPMVTGCLESAGYTGRGLRAAGTRVGVFVAVMWHDHMQSGLDRWRRGAAAEYSSFGSDLANRIAHVLDLRGPAVAVDTSCSSAVTALHLARLSLAAGECDVAVVCAANLLAHPYHFALLAGLGLTATGAEPAAFDATAVGWTPAEGVGALLVRRLPDARRHGDPVLGVVTGTHLGHVGQVARFGSPSQQALTDSIRAALDEVGWRPADVGYVECAAAGASLADAAEVGALVEVFGGGARPGPVPIGTLKPNVGHAEAAAALAQLSKALLQTRYGLLAPTLAAERTNPLIGWDDTAVRLVRSAEPVGGGGLRTLVNAVGANGSIGHVLLRDPR